MEELRVLARKRGQGADDAAALDPSAAYQGILARWRQPTSVTLQVGNALILCEAVTVTRLHLTWKLLRSTNCLREALAVSARTLVLFLVAWYDFSSCRTRGMRERRGGRENRERRERRDDDDVDDEEETQHSDTSLDDQHAQSNKSKRECATCAWTTLVFIIVLEK